MNQLEKEIKEKLKPKKGAIGGHSGIHEIAEFEYTKGLKDGCNFIREKNLPVLFVEWLNNSEWRKLEDLHQDYSDGDLHRTTSELYDYWENNVYGKKK